LREARGLISDGRNYSLSMSALQQQPTAYPPIRTAISSVPENGIGVNFSSWLRPLEHAEDVLTDVYPTTACIKCVIEQQAYVAVKGIRGYLVRRHKELPG